MIGNLADVGQDASRWVPWNPPTGAATGRIRVHCLPHAGGAASVYLPWARSADQPDLDWIPVELPGRGSRLREEPLARMDELADRIVEALFRVPQSDPFVLFGHSMGAYVAAEVVRRLEAVGAAGPLCLVVSGARAPGSPTGRPLHALPDTELIEALVELGGTSEEILRHEELMNLMIPVIRADLTLLARHHEDAAASPSGPLSCPVLALGGTEDRLAAPQWIDGWRATTTGGFRSRIFEGDHFFLHERRAEVAEEIAAFTRSLVVG
ncbi:alpha/beta fold hydrolase [Streptomyces polychromogenes]|uniref:Alpha/beta fold hydrolase n=1 Tax=Streptomyces polychromogenes TaxID=67342 RepID=A0ABN0V7V0_9ACTN